MFHMKQTPPTHSGWRGLSLGEWEPWAVYRVSMRMGYRVAMRVGIVSAAAARS